MKKEEVKTNKVKKNSKIKPDKKNTKFIVIAILVLIVIISLVVGLLLRSKYLSGENTEYKYITSVIETHNNSNESLLDDITLAEAEEGSSDLIFMISGEIQDEKINHLSTINYTDMQITSIIYKDENTIEIANASIDENYNVVEISTLDSTSKELVIYTSEDKEFEYYKNIFSTVVDKIGAVSNTFKDNGVSLFNKTLTDIQTAEYKK